MGRDGFIGDEWQDLEQILEGLRSATEPEETVEERYGMDASELVNYVAENLHFDNREDYNRVVDEFSQDKCHKCVDENSRVDPSLKKHYHSEPVGQDFKHDPDDEKMRGLFIGGCDNDHYDTWMVYSETFRR